MRLKLVRRYTISKRGVIVLRIALMLTLTTRRVLELQEVGISCCIGLLGRAGYELNCRKHSARDELRHGAFETKDRCDLERYTNSWRAAENKSQEPNGHLINLRYP
jgi:hypothetical protein